MSPLSWDLGIPSVAGPGPEVEPHQKHSQALGLAHRRIILFSFSFLL